MTHPVELRVTLATEHADVVSGTLWALGPTAIVEATNEGTTVLIAGFADRARAEQASETVTERTGIDLHTSEIVEVHDDTWLDAWRADAGTVRAGRFVVVPAWLAEDVPTGTTIHIDPGRAFGSGSHPSTQLVLEALADLVTTGASVLDVGCGSGVLSIAAAVAGASAVTAIDIDPAAIVATRANAETNGVAERVAVSLDSLSSVRARFDVVLANLLASTIHELRDDLAARVRPDGHLVLSGLLTDRWEATAAGFPGWPVVAVNSTDGWSAIVLTAHAITTVPDDA